MILVPHQAPDVRDIQSTLQMVYLMLCSAEPREIILVVIYSFIPSCPPSRPYPLSLTPPNGLEDISAALCGPA